MAFLVRALAGRRRLTVHVERTIGQSPRHQTTLPVPEIGLPTTQDVPARRIWEPSCVRQCWMAAKRGSRAWSHHGE